MWEFFRFSVAIQLFTWDEDMVFNKFELFGVIHGLRETKFRNISNTTQNSVDVQWEKILKHSPETSW